MFLFLFLFLLLLSLSLVASDLFRLYCYCLCYCYVSDIHMCIYKKYVYASVVFESSYHEAGLERCYQIPWVSMPGPNEECLFRLCMDFGMACRVSSLCNRRFREGL